MRPPRSAEIHFQWLVPVFDRQVVEGNGPVRRRHVDQDVEAPERIHRLVHHAGAGVRIVVDVAGVERVLGAERRDRVVDLDVKVVDSDR